MNILIINTAFDNADYIVVKDYGGNGGGVMQVFSKKAGSNAKHSETSLAFIDEALNEAGLAIGNIDVVAVNLGPGSFTGIRIGVALAKGFLCANENMRAVGLNSFEPIIPRLYENAVKFNSKLNLFDNAELQREDSLKIKNISLLNDFDESKFINMCKSECEGEGESKCEENEATECVGELGKAEECKNGSSGSEQTGMPFAKSGKVCIPSGKADYYVCEVNGTNYENAEFNFKPNVANFNGNHLNYCILSENEVEEGENCVIFNCDYSVNELVNCVLNKIKANQFCGLTNLEPFYLKLSQAEAELIENEGGEED